MSIIESAAKAATTDSVQDVLDFLVTEEALGVTFVTAAIERAEGTPSEAFLPVLRNAVTQEFHHVEALKDASGTQLTRSYWFPDAAFDNGGVGLFSTLEVVETVEISLYLLGVSAFARRGEDFGARLCAEAMGTTAPSSARPRTSSARPSASPTTSASRTSTGPRCGECATSSRRSASDTASRPATPAASTSTPATPSSAASAPPSHTRGRNEPRPASRATPTSSQPLRRLRRGRTPPPTEDAPTSLTPWSSTSGRAPRVANTDPGWPSRCVPVARDVDAIGVCGLRERRAAQFA